MYFHKNDVLTVLEYTQGEHWWNATLNGKTGLIPATLVRRLKPNESYAGEEKSNVLAEKADNMPEKGNLLLKNN